MGLEVKNGKSYRPIKGFDKGMDLLKYLADQREPVSAKNIANALATAYDTTMCYLVTAENKGFVRNTGEQWELGMGAAMLWARMKAKKEADKQQIIRDIELLQNGGD
jgi:DNA-binding IclR family transcriptional regulator